MSSDWWGLVFSDGGGTPKFWNVYNGNMSAARFRTCGRNRWERSFSCNLNPVFQQHVLTAKHGQGSTWPNVSPCLTRPLIRAACQGHRSRHWHVGRRSSVRDMPHWSVGAQLPRRRDAPHTGTGPAFARPRYPEPQVELRESMVHLGLLDPRESLGIELSPRINNWIGMFEGIFWYILGETTFDHKITLRTGGESVAIPAKNQRFRSGNPSAPRTNQYTCMRTLFPPIDCFSHPSPSVPYMNTM